MNVIKAAIERPIAVVAVVLMALLFGYLALTQIPIQLTPDVRKPVITVETEWAGAAPVEVEREIVNKQEDELKGLEGLESMTSQSRRGQAEITLEFAVGTNMNRALLLVANRLDRVSGYPDEADEPTLGTSGSEDNPIAWFIMKRAPGNTTPIHQFGDFADDVVREAFERVEGISGTNVFGGSERELQIIIRPERLAQYRLTIPQIIERLRSENISVSAGDIDEGKRRYVVRAQGQLNNAADIKAVVMRSNAAAQPGTTVRGLGRVLLGDIAEVEFGYKEPQTRIRHRGEAAIAINVVRETGANVIETMEGVREARDALIAGPLTAQNLTFEQVYDETVYITSAIDLVIQNIWVGGLLAATVLMVFLRSPRATLIVSLSIPISVVASFVAMSALGRTLNVISLAGIAFAVGMVVDAAIVVLENIYRLRQNGLSARDAAYEGARQVWGAILVSALTTVMVFIPILTMELEAGQLFRDIAVAISVAVMLSLVVAITVIPALSSRILTKGVAAKPIFIPVIDHFARAFRWITLKYVRAVNASRAFGLIVVFIVSAGAIAFVVDNLPKLEYLPEGNRNLVFGILIPPPGYNLDTTNSIAERVERAARPLWEEEQPPDGPPTIDSFFFVARTGTSFVGATAVDGTRAGELIPILSRPVFSEPGTFGFMTQPSIFGRGIGGGRAIELNVSGPELEPILMVAGRAAQKIAQLLPRQEGHQFRPLPGLELGSPEVRAVPDRIRLADAGVSARTLAATIDAYNDGVRVDEVTVGADILDLTLKGGELQAGSGGEQTQAIERLPVVTPTGRILPVSALADVSITAGPTEIRHRERLRTITLEVRPSNDMALESALELLEDEVVATLVAEGIPPGVRFSMTGTADELTETWDALQLNLLFALIVVYLVMAVLFESFLLPLVIMISVPVAAAGGVGGLALLNTLQQQPLDMLTLLGFVILVGIVVNNAILIVHQALYHFREEGMASRDAILEAVNNRIRPIFMSTLTSVCGMLPLVLIPGAGSELYRGLGSVVVGGLAVSAVLTLLVVPPLMRILLTDGSQRERAAQTGVKEEEAAAPAE
ncbi:MAG: efflux RND transporter permease subunit [Pseudomonadota bacterium]